MTRHPRVLVFAALIALLGLLPAHAEPTEPFRLEARVPASTLAFASMEEIGTWESRFQETGWGRLFTDPEMQAFMAPLEQAGQEMIQNGMAEVPPIVMEVLTQLQGLKGQVAIALLDVDMEKEWPLAALSLDFGDNLEDFVAFLGRMKTEIDPSGEQMKMIQKDGRPWWTVEAGPGQVHATLVGTSFVLASDEALLSSLVEGGVDGSLASTEDFAAARRQVGGDGDLAMFLYGNVKGALAKFGDQIPPQERAIADAVGLDTITSLAYGMSLDGDGFSDTIALRTPGADHGIVPAFAMQPIGTPRTLDLVPDGAFWWEEVNFPYDDMIARIRSIVQLIDPDATQEMDGGLEQGSQMLGVDIEKEFFAGLSGPAGGYMALPVGGGLYPEFAMILEVKDPATFEGIFDRMAQGIAGLLNEEGDILASTRTIDYHGVTMHLFEMQAARGNDPVPFTPTWAILDRRLVLTLVPYSMKELILRSKGETANPGLASRQEFRSILAKKPVDAAWIEYVNLKGGMSMLYDTAVPLMQTLLKPNVMEDVPLPLDWAQLPPASRVVKYFRSLGAFVTWTKDGIEARIHGPMPMLALVGVAAGAGAFFGMSRASSAMMDFDETFVVEEVPSMDAEARLDLEMAEIHVEMLIDAVQFYYLQQDKLPSTLKDLVESGQMEEVQRDPWGGTYRYEAKGGRNFAIVSAGPDRAFGTDDDIRREK